MKTTKQSKQIPARLKTVSLLFIAVLVLSACTSAKQSDNYGKGTGEPPKKTITLDEKGDNVYALGETAASLDPTKENPNNVGMEYTVTSAKIYSTPEEAGIERSTMVQSEGYNLETGEPKMQNVDDYSFLRCDLEIKNVNQAYGDILNITALHFVYVEPDTKEVKELSFPAYFSNAKETEGDKSEYYHYDLPKNESATMTVGWLVDAEKYDTSNMYLCLGFMGEKEFYRYMELNL